MLFVDASTDRISIGNQGAAPQTTVHIKDSSPTLRIQRNDNAEDSTLDFAGSLGHVGSVVHLANSNDLVFKTHNGSSPEEMFRIGSHHNVLNRQIIFLSGASGIPSGRMQPKEATDIAFFVSGAIGSMGTTNKGAAVFGGDLIVSGGLHLAQTGSGFSQRLSFIDDEKVFVKSPALGILDAVSDITRFGGADLDLSDKPVSSYNPTDSNFFVSGAMGSKSLSSSRGTAILGGDTFVSGALYAGNSLISYSSGSTSSHGEEVVRRKVSSFTFSNVVASDAVIDTFSVASAIDNSRCAKYIITGHPTTTDRFISEITVVAAGAAGTDPEKYEIRTSSGVNSSGRVDYLESNNLPISVTRSGDIVSVKIRGNAAFAAGNASSNQLKVKFERIMIQE